MKHSHGFLTLRSSKFSPKLVFRYLLALLLLLVIAACGSSEQAIQDTQEEAGANDETVAATAEVIPNSGILDPLAVRADGVLLQGYYQKNFVPTGAMNDVTNMRYTPRGFTAGIDLLPTYPQSKVTLLDAGKFAGWDFLRTYHRSIANETYDPNLDFLFLNLSRSATVGVIYYGNGTSYSTLPLPSWLSDWTLAGTIKANYLKTTYPVYTKVFPAGQHYLKPLGQKGLMYSVILSEADGTPSPEPAVPAGMEKPLPNQACPEWVHDQYVATGPDGQMYRTWHPQIDPTYWCYFGHDHGSDPSVFSADWKPLFNRYAHIIGVNEEHEAFKVLVFENATHSAMMTAHMGSSRLRRVCGRFHAFDVVFAEKATREIVGNFAFKGDFGRVQAQTGFGTIATMAPADCPTNPSMLATGGSRSIPVAPGKGYESWRVDFGTAKALPLTGGMSIKSDESITTCSNSKDSLGRYTCDSLVTIPNRYGVRHFFDLFDNVGMDATKAGKLTGNFCTDYTGAVVMSCTDPKAMPQYVKPGAKFQFANMRGIVSDPWIGNYQFDTFVKTNLNLENSVLAPN
jgi:hypothetical protein